MKYQKTPESVSRSRLAAAIARRRDVELEIAAISAASAKLASAALAAAPIELEIARLDAVDAAAISAWCHDPADVSAPAPDFAPRERLRRELDAANLTAASAARAAPAVAAELTAANQRLSVIESEIDAEIALITADEADSVIGEMRALLAGLNAARITLAAAREFVLGTAEATRSTDVFRALERLDFAISDATGNPSPDLAGAYNAANHWRAFSTNLRGDAGALRGTL